MNINSLNELSMLKARLLEKILQGAEEGIEDFNKETIRMCPKNTGQLRESYMVKANDEIIHQGEEIKEVNLPTENNINIEFSYNTDYAKAVHDGRNSRGHIIVNWTTAGTGAGYLETPFALLEEDMKDKILNSINNL